MSWFVFVHSLFWRGNRKQKKSSSLCLTSFSCCSLRSDSASLWSDFSWFSWMAMSSNMAFLFSAVCSHTHTHTCTHTHNVVIIVTVFRSLMCLMSLYVFVICTCACVCVHVCVCMCVCVCVCVCVCTFFASSSSLSSFSFSCPSSVNCSNNFLLAKLDSWRRKIKDRNLNKNKLSF